MPDEALTSFTVSDVVEQISTDNESIYRVARLRVRHGN